MFGGTQISLVSSHRLMVRPLLIKLHLLSYAASRILTLKFLFWFSVAFMPKRLEQIQFQHFYCQGFYQASSHLISVPYLGGRRGTIDDVATIPFQFPPFPVFRCTQGISKPHSHPFLDVIFPSLLLSSSPSCSFHCPLQNCLRHARGS